MDSIYKLQSEIFKALAHPARLQILEALVNRECSFTELMEITTLMKSNLSQQLSMLQANGMIFCVKRGQNKHYKISDTRIAEVMTLIKAQLRDTIARQGTMLGADSMLSKSIA